MPLLVLLLHHKDFLHPLLHLPLQNLQHHPLQLPLEEPLQLVPLLQGLPEPLPFLKQNLRMNQIRPEPLPLEELLQLELLQQPLQQGLPESLPLHKDYLALLVLLPSFPLRHILQRRLLHPLQLMRMDLPSLFFPFLLFQPALQLP